MPRSPVIVMCILISIAAAGFAQADVSLPALFSDHMVLQRDASIPVWGTAAPGEQVTVSLGYEVATTLTGADGKWKVALPAMSAGGPCVMTIAGQNMITLQDVMVGEVWLASGQSNMQMDVSSSQNAKQECAQANYPQIRMFTVKRQLDFEPKTDVSGNWAVCNPQTVGDFSATAYFFARELQRRLRVPIGIIHASWGGTRVQAWMDRATLENNPEFHPIRDELDKTVRDYAESLLIILPQVNEWANQAAQAKANGQPFTMPPSIPVDPRNFSGWWPETPTCLYNGMIAPLVPYSIRGVIWYQGESNAWEAMRYRTLFPAMIQGWRRVWGGNDFPFLFVQLANYGATPTGDGPGDSEWAELREAQTMTLSVPNTGMVVTVDIGEGADIHPKNKQEVGRRLAMTAGHLAYNWPDAYCGPMYASHRAQGNALVLHFTHAEGGLHAAGGEKLRGFAIAGTDRHFYWADAKIDGNTIILSSEKVPQPIAVRYAWGDDPPNNLYNGVGLPASPFRTDDWPRINSTQ